MHLHHDNCRIAGLNPLPETLDFLFLHRVFRAVLPARLFVMKASVKYLVEDLVVTQVGKDQICTVKCIIGKHYVIYFIWWTMKDGSQAADDCPSIANRDFFAANGLPKALTGPL